MPNWCDNTLTIRAKTREIFDDILEFVESDTEPFSLRQIVEPAEHTVDAHNAVWGTKWEVDEVQSTITAEFNLAYFSFYTAWGPPGLAIKKLSEIFPDAYFTLAYDEPGMNFGGFQIYLAGQVFAANRGESRANTWAELSIFELEDHQLWTEEDMIL